MNGHMQAQWYIEDSLIETTPRHERDVDCLTFDVVLPTQITIQVSGKNPDLDTKVVDGHIVADKYLTIEKMSLGGYPISPLIIDQLCDYRPQGQSPEKQRYFYRNGTVIMNFSEKDILTWHLKHNIIHVP